MSIKKLFSHCKSTRRQRSTSAECWNCTTINIFFGFDRKCFNNEEIRRMLV